MSCRDSRPTVWFDPPGDYAEGASQIIAVLPISRAI